jgi:hypothetical protein
MNERIEDQGQKQRFSRFSIDDFDAQLLLAVDAKKGLWMADWKPSFQRATWTAGQMPTCMTAHGLAAVAIISVLRPLQRKQLDELSQRGARIGQKPRLQIVTSDVSFVAAINAAMAKQGQSKPLRTGKNFVVELARQLSRFEVSIAAQPDNRRILSLRNWGQRVVLDPSIPPSLAPVAASILN